MSDIEEQAQPELEQVAIYYEKSHQFRTIHANGAWAGISPQAEIQLTFFTDLQPMPEVVVHEIAPGGGLGRETERVVRGGFVRECEVRVVLSSHNARQLIDMLQRLLDQVDTIAADKTQKDEG